jgi:anti-sigma factor RsiW
MTSHWPHRDSGVDIHTLAGAYALDAVDDIERAAFDRHLAGCASCAQELSELQATVARLTDLNAAVPPAGLRQSVLAEAARTRQVPPGGRAAGRARSRSWRTWAAAAAAAVVIAVAGGSIGYVISDQNTRSANATVAAQQSESARVAAILSAPDATVHVQTVKGGKISVVVAPSLNEGVALVSNMPATPPAKTYQLWLIHGTDPQNQGIMASGQLSGTVFLTDVRGATNFGVSLENVGGATAPTQPLVTSFPV